MNTDIITPDATEKARRLNSEALSEAAIEIRNRHAELEQETYHARNFAQAACSKALEISTLVEQVHATLGGPRFASWWRDQNLPAGWGKKYLTIARTRREQIELDKDQLRLIGILPDNHHGNPGTHHQADGQSSFAWIKWAAKIPAAIPPEKVKDMDEADRRSALKHLEPIKRLIEELERGIA